MRCGRGGRGINLAEGNVEDAQVFRIQYLKLRANNDRSVSRAVPNNLNKFNLEVQCVPDKRTESLLAIFKKICEEIKVPIIYTDICSVCRVAKLNPQSIHPRSILVTLPSERHRDNISAVRRYNKNQPSTLISAHLGIHGNAINIYVSDIAPHTKKIHTAARNVSKERGYKYTWVRFGRIYVRKDDTSPAVVIKVLKDLESR
ncbi:hypothetical protein EVAR_85262_1 [Eumeta japonica]|uniref:FP protein C-terminal domain-containing protein n=1 Tax=Eumeta variegata TaxID=151549 RepID=A0A4C1V8B3_EUMVA|nr:hypothetical protein EVAR_85262_1 [Eumeta japonica]